MQRPKSLKTSHCVLALTLFGTLLSQAQETEPTLNSGHTAWMLLATALGSLHDDAGAGVVLRRPRAGQEPALGDGAMRGDRVHGLAALGGLPLQPRLQG